ncbi:MAG: stage V sporulation protein S [Dethiobacteraceae bacterium]
MHLEMQNAGDINRVVKPIRVSETTEMQDLKDAIMAEVSKYGMALVDTFGENTNYTTANAFILARGHAQSYGVDLTSKLSYVNLKLEDEIKIGIRWKITVEGDLDKLRESK